jgi:hypothetical protein
MLLRMAKRNRRSFGKLLRGAVKDVVVPTSMGLGLAISGCGSSGDKADSPLWAVMPPIDGASRADGPITSSDARRDTPILAIMPPDTAVDGRVDTRVYAIMPPRDAGPDTGDARPDFPIYAIMPLAKDAAQDTRDGGPDYRIPYYPESPDLALPDRQDTMAPDATKPPKEVGPIYAIMPLAVLPPRG